MLCVGEMLCFHSSPENGGSVSPKRYHPQTDFMVSYCIDDNIKLVMLLFYLVLFMFVFIIRIMRSVLYDRELHYKQVPAFLFIWSVILLMIL